MNSFKFVGEFVPAESHKIRDGHLSCWDIEKADEVNPLEPPTRVPFSKTEFSNI